MMETLKNQDLPRHLANVVMKYGRPMVALVFGAGLGSEATKVLGQLAECSRDGAVLHAVRVLAQVYNETSTAYAKSQGWTEGMLAECDRDIQLAFSAQLVRVDGGLLGLQ
jgi:hypothetical protein